MKYKLLGLPVKIVQQNEVERILGSKLEEFLYDEGTCWYTEQEKYEGNQLITVGEINHSYW